jgi:hypothetical protein
VNLAVNCYEKGGKLFGGGGREAGRAAARSGCESGMVRDGVEGGKEKRRKG